jgi:MFS family permease
VISRRSIAALQHRNFRLIWAGLLFSHTGSMMQSAGLLWHVSLLVPPDKKGLGLGIVGLVRFLPIVVFSLVSGVVADAVNRRRLMLVTQSAAASVALLLAVLTFRGAPPVWQVYALAAVGAGVSTFDMPARQALVPTLVPREHLPNAINLNMIMFQTASVAGPALAGILIAAAGVGWVYVADAISFGFVIVALLMMDGRSPGGEIRKPKPDHDPISLAAAFEGLRFVFRTPLIRSTMLLDFFATFFSSATALLPIYAQDILRVGPHGYGWLYAAPAVGAVLASLVLIAVTERIDRRGGALLWAVTGYGVATVVFGVSRSFWLSFACLALTGITDTVSAVLRSIIRNLETPDRLRGRMIGINMVFFVGGPQLGEFEAGAAAALFGATASVVTGGLGCLAATAWIAWSTPAIRHYRQAHAQPIEVSSGA